MNQNFSDAYQKDGYIYMYLKPKGFGKMIKNTFYVAKKFVAEVQ